MRVLAIDPGATVGLAIVDSTKDIMYHAAIPLAQAGAAIISKLLNDAITHIIYEQPPLRPSQGYDAWAVVQEVLKRHTEKDEVLKVTPGQWKPLTEVLKQGTEDYKTQHEKDAVCIARFCLRQAREAGEHQEPPIGHHRGIYRDKARIV